MAAESQATEIAKEEQAKFLSKQSSPWAKSTPAWGKFLVILYNILIMNIVQKVHLQPGQGKSVKTARQLNFVCVLDVICKAMVFSCLNYCFGTA